MSPLFEVHTPSPPDAYTAVRKCVLHSPVILALFRLTADRLLELSSRHD
jgi:hypothetical protein